MISKSNPMLRVPFEKRRPAPENSKPMLNWSSVSQSSMGHYTEPFAAHPVIEEMLLEIQTCCQQETSAPCPISHRQAKPVGAAFGDPEKTVDAKFSTCASQGENMEMGFDGGKSIRMSVQGSAKPRFIIYPANMESWRAFDVPGLAFAIAKTCQGEKISSISHRPGESGGTLLIIRSQDYDRIILVVDCNAQISFCDDQSG